MSLRKITVLHQGNGHDDAALYTALKLGNQYNAHVHCIYLSPDPRSCCPQELEVPAYVNRLVQDLETENENNAKEALREFEITVKKTEVELFQKNPAPARSVSVSFDHLIGQADKIISKEGKYTDLLVIGRKLVAYSMNTEAAIATALLATSKPLLFVPDELPNNLTDVVAIAWNESVESSRAVTAAMPLIKKAKKVYIITVGGSSTKKSDDSRNDLKDYLQIYGVKSEVLVLKKTKFSTSKTLINAANDIGATMLIMGAYTHNRLREDIFGGVTKYMIEEAKLPVLMAH